MARAAAAPVISERNTLPQAKKRRVLPARLAVEQFPPVEPVHAAVGGLQDRLRGGGVPLHRAAEARIEVGRAFSEAAKFEAGADMPDRAHPVVGEESLQARLVAVMATGEHVQAVGGRQ